MKIAVDVMGSDLGYEPLIKAVVKFVQTYNDVEIIIVGQITVIKPYLKSLNLKTKVLSKITLQDATTVITMNDSILDVRRKNNNSMAVAIQCVADQQSQAVLSAGATGPYLAANHFILGEINGVVRPGFMAIMPTKIQGKEVIVLDVGANVENTSYDLEVFALIANIYAQKIWKITNPKIALLNIGTEPHKGKDFQKETYQKLMNNDHLNFVGNIEPHHFMDGTVDIVVSDGFTGNVTLKAVEGMGRNLMTTLKEKVCQNIFRKIWAFLLRKAFRDVKAVFDYRNTGGAILIGVKGIVFKAHGNSDLKSFFSTLKLVRQAILEDVMPTVLNSDLQTKITGDSNDRN